MTTSLPSQSVVEVNPRQLIKQVEYQLKELAKTPEVLISSLPPDSHLYGRYVRAFNIVKRFYDSATADEYAEIIRFIGTLPRPARIDVGTFGSYIFGCLYNIPKDGNFMCSPLCSNSIPPHKGEIEACSSQIWYVQGDTLVYRSGSGSEAVVFQASKPLSAQQKERLMANGAKRVTLYSPMGESIDSNDLSLLQATQVPTSMTTPQAPTASDVVTTPVATAPNAIAAVAQASNAGVQRGVTSFFSDWRIILVFVVVIVLVGVLIYAVYTMLKKAEDKTAQSVATTTEQQTTQPQVVPASPRVVPAQ